MSQYAQASTFRQWWSISIAWLYLLTAAGIFAAVVIAPKLLTRTLLEKQYTETQLRLVLFEQQVERAEGIAKALEEDPKFAASVARKDFANHLEPNSELVPMPPELSLDIHALDTPYDLPPFPLPWYTETLKHLTFNEDLIRILLSVAALLTVLSFITTSSAPEREAEGSMLQRLGERYSAVPPPKFNSRSGQASETYVSHRSDVN